MSVAISWDIEGSKQLSRVLKGIGDGIKDWTPAFKESSEELAKIFANEVFDTEGRQIGEKWKALKPSYLAAKRKAGYSGGILERTGEMRKSFKSQFSGSDGRIWNAATYFQYHQSDKPRKVLPRRVMMKLGENEKQIVVKIFHTYWYQKTHKK